MNLLSQVYEFAMVLPGMVGPDGLPLSWKHFQYGLKEIRKHNARESLRMSGAAAIARSSKEDYEGWRREMRIEAGYD